jgi:two-component system sensor histidine kinase BaeS
MKFILAFLTISLVSIALVVLFARYTTREEFSKFIFTSDRSGLVTNLAEFYKEQGSWAGIENKPIFSLPPRPPVNDPSRRDAVVVADISGKVVRAGAGYSLGSSLPPDVLMHADPILVNGNKVGYLYFNRMPFGENTQEAGFIQRTNLLFLYSAFGTTAVALILGILLSSTLSRPIRELTVATREVSEGNLSLQVPVRSRDEMGQLAASFNRMSAELARSFNLRRQMTADIAHELRTPLSLILGHAEGVHDGVLEPTPENFEIIREEALRLERLVDDLRLLSLADAGELPQDLEMVAPEKLIRSIAARYQHQVNQKDITLKVDLAPELPDVYIDSGRMNQVFSNILDNALRHTPQGGQVVFAVQAVENGVEFVIQDSGAGVSDPDLARIFDRFYRAEPARDRESGGSGLGLAIAKSIVEAHNGTIKAQCETGLKIIIRLPVQTPDLNAG